MTLRVPAPLLLSLPAERLEWLVPGLLETKCVALVRNLPKALRKNFVPVPDFVKAALQRMVFAEGSLPQALGRELLRMTGVRVTDEAWAEAAQQVESHLKMNLEVVDANGKFLGEGRELDELTARFAEASQAALAVPQSAKGQQPVEAKGFAAVAAEDSAEDRRAVDDGVSGAGGRGRCGQGRAFLDPGRGRISSTVEPCNGCCCSSWPSRPSSCAASCPGRPSWRCCIETWVGSMR